jgi:hypothetical protein
MNMIVPDILYHYTSQEGLMGIFKRRSIWMTDIYYLNDSSEFRYAADLTIQEIEKSKKKLVATKKIRAYRGSSPPNTDEELFDNYDTFLNFLYKKFMFEKGSSCIFSLSKKDDDLDQWRGYCPNGGGYCIAFNTTKLPITGALTRLLRCEYDVIKQQKILENILAPFYLKKDDKSQKPIILQVMTNWFLKAACFLKDEAFKNEEEWRLIGMYDFKELKFRGGKSGLIPYYEYNIEDDEGKLPIEKIIIGPSPHKELSERSVKAFLESLGVDYIHVDISKVPYRPL